MTNVQNVAIAPKQIKSSTSVSQNGVYRPIKTFMPVIDECIQALNTVLAKDFPLLDNCIWTTEWLNDFAIHQSVRTYTIVEVEENAGESLFYHLRAKGFRNVFLEPDTLLMERYVSGVEDPIIIQKLLVRSPLMSIKIGNDKTVKLPKLEKILVDVYCDTIVFSAYKGHEQDQIFKHVFKNYALDMKTLFAYAERRKRKTSLIQYLHFNDLLL